MPPWPADYGVCSIIVAAHRAHRRGDQHLVGRFRPFGPAVPRCRHTSRRSLNSPVLSRSNLRHISSISPAPGTRRRASGGQHRSRPSSFKFDQIDVSEAAPFVGPTAAPERIVAQLSGANLHFMDIICGAPGDHGCVPAGECDKESSAVQGRLPPDFVAQHVTAPEVSQHYGECEVGS
jgi:hypothetical protein